MKFSPRLPKICISNRWTLDTDLSGASVFIEVVDNKPDTDRVIPKQVSINKTYEFLDLTPELIAGKPINLISPAELRDMEGVIASREDVAEALRLIRRYLSGPIIGSLVLHESSPPNDMGYCGRVSAFAVAAEYMHCKNLRWAVYNIANKHKNIKPNLWVAGLIDYELGENGKFFEVIQELVAFGIVVSPAGNTIHMDWSSEDLL